jgi:imidazolonepropionase-like amidohydrolase
MRKIILTLLVFGALAGTSFGQSRTVVFRGAKVYPASRPPIERGVIVVTDGKIQAVGAEKKVSIPRDAMVVDVSGKFIIPGIVDSHTHIGIESRPPIHANADQTENTGPVQPGMRAVDSIWPGDPGIRLAQAGGVTTANIMPGSGNVVGGQTAYVKLHGHTIEEMLIPGTIGGMKMANGENPKHYGQRGQTPATRMGEAALERRLYVRAQEYKRTWDDYNQAKATGKADAKPPQRDLDIEPVVEVLEGKRIVHHHTHRADDIMTIIRLSEEFHFRVVIHHGTEAWKVADELARHKVPVSLIIIDSPGGKQEMIDYNPQGAAILEHAGVKVSIHTDAEFVNGSRFLLREGAMAVRGGMTEAGALRALTLNAAEILDLGDRVGSLDPGKDADLVVLSGPPFSVYSKVLATYIGGEKVFDLSRPQDRHYSTGGFAVADRYPLLGGGQ